MQLISSFSRGGETLSRNEKVAMFWKPFEVPMKMGISRQKYRSSPKQERALETLLGASLQTLIFAAPKTQISALFHQVALTGLFNTPRMHSERYKKYKYIQKRYKKSPNPCITQGFEETVSSDRTARLDRS